MKLTVLGKYGPFPGPGGACSGYLLESGGVRLVLDMGNGTLSRLFQQGGITNLSGILLSHLHSDHMGDMMVLRYALQQFRARGMDAPIPLPVAAPAEPEQEYRQLSACGTYDLMPIADGMTLRFGNLAVKFQRMIHPVPSYSMDITDGTRRLFYTGDTGYFPELPGLCRGADMLLADCGLLHGEKTTAIAPHLTAREAGELARDAGAGQLLCSHIWGGYEDEAVLAEARLAFPAAQAAKELHTYEI